MVGVDAAQHGDDHQHAQQRVAGVAEQNACRPSQGEVLTGDLRHGQHVDYGRVHQQINSHHRKHAADHGAGNVFARVAYLFAEIHHRIPAVVGVNDGLQRKHQGSSEG